jgi:hypothetical protein
VLDPTTPFWASLHLTPTQSFFALLWEQLCDGSTHDAWQLRAMGLPAVLLEIVEVCAASRTFPPLQHALGDLLDEAISLSHRDVVLKDHFRSATAVLEDKRLREGSSSALTHVELISLYLLDTLRPYPSLLKGELERLLATPSVREKQRLKLVASAFGTELRAKGFSRLFLQSFAARLATSSFAETAGELMSLLDLPATSFRCILPVKWPGFHRGALPIRSEHLIQHLHTYLAMTLHCLVREIGDSEILTVPAALARRRALYRLYLSKIQDRSLTFRNLLAEESCWVAPPDARIWPDVAAAR